MQTARGIGVELAYLERGEGPAVLLIHDLAADALTFAPVTEALAKQREALSRALADGGPAAAVEAWLGGRVEGAALERARAAHRAFFADYAGLATLALTRAQLRAIAVPVVVVTDQFSPPVI